MKQKLMIAAVVVGQFFAAQWVWAQNAFTNAGTQLTTAGKAAYGQGASDNLPKTIGTVIQFVLAALGVVLVIIIVRGGVIYMLAGGDEGKTKEGKAYIVNGVIGLFICIIAYALAAFVVSRLGGVTAGTTTP